MPMPIKSAAPFPQERMGPSSANSEYQHSTSLPRPVLDNRALRGLRVYLQLLAAAVAPWDTMTRAWPNRHADRLCPPASAPCRALAARLPRQTPAPTTERSSVPVPALIWSRSTHRSFPFQFAAH